MKRQGLIPKIVVTRYFRAMTNQKKSKTQRAKDPYNQTYKMFTFPNSSQREDIAVSERLEKN